MVRRVFFSFHYERDIWRANIVRNSWVTKPDREAAGFVDATVWEKACMHSSGWNHCSNYIKREETIFYSLVEA